MPAKGGWPQPGCRAVIWPQGGRGYGSVHDVAAHTVAPRSLLTSRNQLGHKSNVWYSTVGACCASDITEGYPMTDPRRQRTIGAEDRLVAAFGPVRGLTA